MPKISTKKKYEKNPFILELKGKMYLQPRANTIIAKGEAIMDKATGEIIQEDGVLMGRRKLIDKSQFAKIYASEIGLLFELSKPAINIFLYLSKVMDYENKAFLRWEKIYKSYSAIFRGIRELIKADIIAPTLMQNVYWLNPTIICKGERFAIYTEYIYDKELDKEEEGKKILKEQAQDKEEVMLKNDIAKKIEIANNQTILPI